MLNEWVVGWVGGWEERDGPAGGRNAVAKGRNEAGVDAPKLVFDGGREGGLDDLEGLYGGWVGG